MKFSFSRTGDVGCDDDNVFDDVPDNDEDEFEDVINFGGSIG